ncbi:MAG TPA: methyltransferase domain-containing protein [Frankiaceae bacterium]|nr:methyltransferase domain-containing protein [Frankiaceae bacterium]
MTAHSSARAGSSEPDAGLDAALLEESDADPYPAFAATVALRQLAQWLPLTPVSVLDLSLPLPDASAGFDSRVSDVVMAAGHRVVSVSRGAPEGAARRHSRPSVVGDPRSLTWIRSESVDAIVAEGGALSDSLATEDTLRDIARILRPGGRLLASADSLVLGLARLAEQNRWPELADAPAADVVLAPDPEHEGNFFRYFAPDDLAELLTGCGLEVEWVRPRTALPAAAIRRTLLSEPDSMGDLVLSELSLAAEQAGEAHGARLVVSGRKPA